MTEPEHAGSDPRSIATEAVREGDEWVINGHKWFTSNGIDADFFIVMCRTVDPSGEMGSNGRMSQIIVPATTPGVNIVRGIGIFGRSSSDHCEIRYENVRVPIENTLGLVGQGHQAAQDRLGRGPRVPLHELHWSDVASLSTSWSNVHWFVKCTGDC